MAIRIVIADDHEMYRKGFDLLLRKQKEIQIVGEAENGLKLLEIIERYNPNVVITDIQMPVMDGIKACVAIKKLQPDLPVIALTSYNDDNLIIDMIQAGASGYLLKNTTSEELVNAINVVLSGGPYFSKETFVKIKRMIIEKRLNPNKPHEQVEFSEYEKEIIILICRGLSSKEVGLKLNRSYRTIEGYKTRILERIGAKNVINLVVYAIKNKIYNP